MLRPSPVLVPMLLMLLPASASAKEFWAGTAPICRPKKSDCTKKGYVFVREGKKNCRSGKKILCRSWEEGDKPISTWKGTAPACEAQPRDCRNIGLLYERKHKSGDGKRCTSGYKVQCVSPRMKKKTKRQWMSKVKSSKKLNELLIPGTHNSGTNSFSPKRKISPDKKDLKWSRKLGQAVMHLWGRTQARSIRSQLERGARYLDIRTCMSGRQYFACHALYGDPIEQMLAQVASFLKANKKEVVILSFSHFYAPGKFGTQEHDALVAKIVGSLRGAGLYPNKGKMPTLAEMREAKARVLVLYKGSKRNALSKADHKKLLWDEGAMVEDHYSGSGWQSASKLKKAQTKAYKNPKGKQWFWKVQGVLTPDAGMIAKLLARWEPNTLLDVGRLLNVEIQAWMKKEWKGRLGIVMVDALGDTTLHEAIIRANGVR